MVCAGGIHKHIPSTHTAKKNKPKQQNINRYAPAFVWLLEYSWLRAIRGCAPRFLAYGLAGALVLELLWARVLVHQVRVAVGGWVVGIGWVDLCGCGCRCEGGSIRRRRETHKQRAF